MGLGLQIFVEAVGVGHGHLVNGLFPAGNSGSFHESAAVAETRLPCFALLAARLSSILQIISHSVLSADSSLVNCTLLRVALRSSLLNDSIEFVV